MAHGRVDLQRRIRRFEALRRGEAACREQRVGRAFQPVREQEEVDLRDLVLRDVVDQAEGGDAELIRGLRVVALRVGGEGALEIVT